MASLPADTNRLRSRPSSVLPGVRRIPAHIHQVGAGELAVSLGGLAVGSSRTPSVSLTGPEPSGRTARLRLRLLSALPGVSRLRLPPASPARYDGPAVQVLHLHSKQQRLVAHVSQIPVCARVIL